MATTAGSQKIPLARPLSGGSAVKTGFRRFSIWAQPMNTTPNATPIMTVVIRSTVRQRAIFRTDCSVVPERDL